MANITSESTRSSAATIRYVLGKKPGHLDQRFVAASAIGCPTPLAEDHFRACRKQHGKDGIVPKLEVDKRGRIVRDEDGNPVPVRNEDGEVVMHGRYVHAYSFVESFGHDELDPDDPDSWSKAQELGRAFVEDQFPGRMALIVTQVDGASGCVHNHIVVNSIETETGLSLDSNLVTHSRLAIEHDRILAENDFEQREDMAAKTVAAKQRIEATKQEVMARGYDPATSEQVTRAEIKKVRFGRDPKAKTSQLDREEREYTRYLANEQDRAIAKELGIAPEPERFSITVLRHRVRQAIDDPRGFVSREDFKALCTEHRVMVTKETDNDISFGMLREQPDGSLAEPAKTDIKRGKTLFGPDFSPAVIDELIEKNTTTPEQAEAVRRALALAQADAVDLPGQLRVCIDGIVPGIPATIETSTLLELDAGRLVNDLSTERFRADEVRGHFEYSFEGADGKWHWLDEKDLDDEFGHDVVLAKLEADLAERQRVAVENDKTADEENEQTDEPEVSWWSQRQEEEEEHSPTAAAETMAALLDRCWRFAEDERLPGFSQNPLTAEDIAAIRLVPMTGEFRQTEDERAASAEWTRLEDAYQLEEHCDAQDVIDRLNTCDVWLGCAQGVFSDQARRAGQEGDAFERDRMAAHLGAVKDCRSQLASLRQGGVGLKIDRLTEHAGDLDGWARVDKVEYQAKKQLEQWKLAKRVAVNKDMFERHGWRDPDYDAMEAAGLDASRRMDAIRAWESLDKPVTAQEWAAADPRPKPEAKEQIDFDDDDSRTGCKLTIRVQKRDRGGVYVEEITDGRYLLAKDIGRGPGREKTTRQLRSAEAEPYLAALQAADGHPRQDGKWAEYTVYADVEPDEKLGGYKVVPSTVRAEPAAPTSSPPASWPSAGVGASSTPGVEPVEEVKPEPKRKWKYPLPSVGKDNEPEAQPSHDQEFGG